MEAATGVRAYIAENPKNSAAVIALVVVVCLTALVLGLYFGLRPNAAPAPQKAPEEAATKKSDPEYHAYELSIGSALYTLEPRAHGSTIWWRARGALPFYALVPTQGGAGSRVVLVSANKCEEVTPTALAKTTVTTAPAPEAVPVCILAPKEPPAPTGPAGSTGSTGPAGSSGAEPTDAVYTVRLGSETVTLSPMSDSTDGGRVWWSSQSNGAGTYYAMISPRARGSPPGSPWRVVLVASAGCTVVHYATGTSETPPLTGWSGDITLASASPAARKPGVGPCKAYLHPTYTTSGWQSLAKFGTLEPKTASNAIWWQTKQVEGASVAVVDTLTAWSLLLLKGTECETLATQPKPKGGERSDRPLTGASWLYPEGTAAAFSLGSSGEQTAGAATAPGGTCLSAAYPTFSVTKAPSPLATALRDDLLFPRRAASGVVWWRSAKQGPYVAIVPTAAGSAWSLVHVDAECVQWATLAAQSDVPASGPSAKWSADGVVFDFTLEPFGTSFPTTPGEMPAAVCAARAPPPQETRPAYSIAGTLSGTLAPVNDGPVAWWVSEAQPRRTAIVPQGAKWQLVTLESGKCTLWAESPKGSDGEITGTWSAVSTGAPSGVSVTRLAAVPTKSEPIPAALTGACSVGGTSKLTVGSAFFPPVVLAPRSATTSAWYYGELKSKSEYALGIALVRTNIGWALYSLSQGEPCSKIAETKSGDVERAQWAAHLGAFPLSVTRGELFAATDAPLPPCAATVLAAAPALEVTGDPARVFGKLTLSPMLMAGRVFWAVAGKAPYTSIALVPAGAQTWWLLGVTANACETLAVGTGASADASTWTVQDAGQTRPISMQVALTASAALAHSTMPHFVSSPTPSRALLPASPPSGPSAPDTDWTIRVTSSVAPQIPVGTVLYPKRASAASKVAGWWEGTVPNGLDVVVASGKLFLVHRDTGRCHRMSSSNQEPLGPWTGGFALANVTKEALETKPQPSVGCDDTTPHLVLKSAPAALQSIVNVNSAFLPMREGSAAWQTGGPMWWQAQAQGGYTSVAVRWAGAEWHLVATKTGGCDTIAVGRGASPVGAVWSIPNTSSASSRLDIAFELAPNATILQEGAQGTQACTISTRLSPAQETQPAAALRTFTLTTALPTLQCDVLTPATGAGQTRWVARAAGGTVHVIDLRKEPTFATRFPANWAICMLGAYGYRGLALSLSSSLDPPAEWSCSWVLPTNATVTRQIPRRVLSIAPAASAAPTPQTFVVAAISWGDSIRLPEPAPGVAGFGVPFYKSKLSVLEIPKSETLEYLLAALDKLAAAYAPTFFAYGLRWLYTGDSEYPDLFLQRWSVDIPLPKPTGATWVVYERNRTTGALAVRAFTLAPLDGTELPPADAAWVSFPGSSPLKFQTARGTEDGGVVAIG